MKVPRKDDHGKQFSGRQMWSGSILKATGAHWHGWSKNHQKSGVSHHENLEDFRNHGGFLQENLNLTLGLKHKAWTKSPSLCVANRLCQR